jgi:aminoglycoside phosphotransferase (APT) family kinase protein
MARSHLTLAALATSAVTELDVAGASRFGSARGGDFDAALLTGSDGRHWVVRVPRSERAEAEQSADLVALRALSAGVRGRLPFVVSTFAGQTPIDGTRAVVYEFVYGTKVERPRIVPELATSIGEAIAAIHGLPTSFVVDAGLPVDAPVDALRASAALIDRAASTGLVPAALMQRWEGAIEDSPLWQFTPVVVNGGLGSESFLSADSAVTGVLGWHSLRVGDPARDLHWLLGTSDDEVAGIAFDAYTRVRGSADRRLRQRATLLSELEVARWLLHGTQVRSTEIVDDAVQMMSNLVDEVNRDVMNPIGPQTMPVLGVDEVEALLERAERSAS